MRRLFECSRDICFRFYSDEIDVSDRHHLLNDDQLQNIAQMVWGADVKTEVVRNIENVITIRIDSSTGNRSEHDEIVERILIRKVAEAG